MSAPLILASTSAYRAALLRRITDAFTQQAPDCDERALPAESIPAQAARLAATKAASVALQHADALILGSDQLAALDHMAIGKPGDHANARRQLRAVSERVLEFHTAWCLIDAANRQRWQGIDVTRVYFRALGDDEIERYLDREPAFDCAGSAKSEALGISLLSGLAGDDPTALVGLPLIALAAMLRQEGAAVP